MSSSIRSADHITFSRVIIPNTKRGTGGSSSLSSMLSTPSRFSFRKRSSSEATLPFNMEPASARLPSSAPPPLPVHHSNTSHHTKPPGISTARHQSCNSLSSLKSSPDSVGQESPAQRIRHRLSSFLTGGSPDRRNFRIPLFSGKKRSSQTSSTHETLSMVGDESGCSSSDESDDQATPSPPAVSPGNTLKDKHLWNVHNNAWIDPTNATAGAIHFTVSSKPPLDLAQQVRLVLGSTLTDIDIEIDEEWERRRHLVCQSLTLPQKTVY